MRNLARTRALPFAILTTVTLLASAVGVLVVAAPSGASVVTDSGAVLVGPPLPDVPVATAQSNQFINMFTERTDLTLPTSTPVDITPDGSSSKTYRIGVDHLTPSTLAMGTPVDSYCHVLRSGRAAAQALPVRRDPDLQHSRFSG